jgi:hypothetical protein
LSEGEAIPASSPLTISGTTAFTSTVAIHQLSCLLNGVFVSILPCPVHFLECWSWNASMVLLSPSPTEWLPFCLKKSSSYIIWFNLPLLPHPSPFSLPALWSSYRASSTSFWFLRSPISYKARLLYFSITHNHIYCFPQNTRTRSVMNYSTSSLFG